MFFKPKIVYTDILQEYRNILLPWWFRSMDKILYRSHWHEDEPWKKAIVYGIMVCNEGRRWYKVLRYKREWTDEIDDWIISYDPGMTDNWYCDVKKDYWEFQEEFEAIYEAKREMEKVERLSKELAESREKSEKLYQKGKRILEENIHNQFWIWKSSDK